MSSRVHIVFPSDSSVTPAGAETVDIDSSWRLFVRGDVVWTVQTYCVLKERGIDGLSCGYEFDPSAINISHVDVLTRLNPGPDVFLVAIRADKHRQVYPDIEIVQNQSQSGRFRFFVPHWPQPGLIRRNATRQTVSNIAYSGAAHHIRAVDSLITADTKRKIREMGLNLVYLDPMNWNNYSRVDVLLGIRDFDRETHDHKPPSKLINAWLARVLFIGGHDSAFSQIGEPGRDFVRVDSEEQLLEQLHRLRQDPYYYRSLVDNGTQKAQSFSREAIAKEWLTLLTGPIESRYCQWRNRPLAVRKVLFWTRRLVGRGRRVGTRRKKTKGAVTAL